MIHSNLNIKNETYYNLLLLAITLGNLWIWRILKENFVVGILLMISSLLLFKQVITKVKKSELLAIIFIFIAISVLTLRVGFDKNIFLISDIEAQKIGKRHEYYAAELGKIYRNRIGIFYFNNLRFYIGKINNNIFSALDFNSYFPSKYPTLLSPLFLVGFLYLLINIKKTQVVYFLVALLISGFINFDNKFGGILLFPIINLCIATGLLRLLGILKNKYSFIK